MHKFTLRDTIKRRYLTHHLQNKNDHHFIFEFSKDHNIIISIHQQYKHDYVFGEIWTI